MNPLAWAARQSGRTRVLVSAAVLAAALVGVVALDFLATRRELLSLLREQAAALRQTVAAAARSNREAARLAEEQLAARLLETARLLGELDGRGALDAARLDALVERHRLFRVAVFAQGGALELASGGGGGAGQRRDGTGPHFRGGRGDDGAAGLGRGRGGPGPGFGRGLLTRLLEGGENEAVSDVHTSRWGGEARLAAGVRRTRGGAIVVNVDAGAVERLSRQASLDALLHDVVEHAPALAYVVFAQGGVQIARGIPAPEPPPGDAPAERAHELPGGPVMEFAGPVPVGGDAAATLRLGLRLDGVRRAERRMLAVLALTLATSLTLAFLGTGVVWLQRKYELLSVRHARAQEALRRRDRLAAMGELASTVAHEVRNPLNAIAMSAQRLRREFLDTLTLPQGDGEARAEATELLGVIESESQRLERTVRQFQEFARPKPLVPRLTSLRELVASVAETLRPRAEAAGVTLAADVAAAGEAEVDPDLLRQALDNLTRNALEATPAGGCVTLTARSDASGHTLEVADTGHGIAPEHLPRLFDLYFTTKPDGTGVGLAVTQQVIGAHGGTLEVDSQPGAGARLTVRLPRAARGDADVPAAG